MVSALEHLGQVRLLRGKDSKEYASAKLSVISDYRQRELKQRWTHLHLLITLILLVLY